MPSFDSLQLIVVRHPLDADVQAFEDAAFHALQGGAELGTYLASGADLGVQILQFDGQPAKAAPDVLDAARHTLLVILTDSELLADSQRGLWNWIGNAWEHCRSSGGKHGLLILPMEERMTSRIVEMTPVLSTLQITPVHALGDRAIRPAMFALLLLHRCRTLLAGPDENGVRTTPLLRLFISHAKIDGLPLAQALKHQVDGIPWLKGFYDARDLPPGCDWQEELEIGVRDAIIVMLRTDEYDGRPWCQQEVRWADEYATPAVLVDARTRLTYGPSSLPLERVPVVRIPDGNLLRILFAALREDLRFLLFVSRVQDMRQDGMLPPDGHYRIFSFPPGMAAILRALRSLSLEDTDKPRYIVYPDPPLPTGTFEAAQALVEVVASGVILTTPQSLAASVASGSK